MSPNRPKAVTVTALAAAALAAAAAVTAGAGAPPGPGAAPGAALLAAASRAKPAPVTSPLTPSQCQVRYKTPCYDADLLRKIYGVAGLRDEGQGAVVALILPYHNPVLRHDLDTYARQAGLPVPDLHVITVGHPATASPSNPIETLASMEGEGDAEMILAMAPRVRLDYVEVPAGQTLSRFSPSAFGGAATVLDTLTKLRPAVDAVSFSYGYYEQDAAQQAGGTAAGDALIRRQATQVNAAIRAGITVMQATGDFGSAGANLAGTGYYKQPTVMVPADDPLVTAVGGTEVHADDSGTRTAPDTVWADGGDGFAAGGGLSAVFSRPPWQDPYAALTGSSRGVGDVAMDAATETPVWIYSSRYDVIPNQAPGWVRVDGTSVAAPLFTGIVALAASLAGHPLGEINPALYAMARRGAADGVERVTSGCNGDEGVRGYCAAPGPWSLPDGIGTVGNAARFVPALAAAASRH